MRCHICGAEMSRTSTDLPFKVENRSIVIIKELPVYQCTNCREFLMDDSVVERIDKILNKISGDTELEIIRYAA